MEIQGMTLLVDLQKSIKKGLYREVVKRVERKIQKDPAFPRNSYFLDILFQEIQAVHGLLEQFIIGRFDKCPSKVNTLVKIINRNIKICSKLLKYRMGNGEYLNLKAYRLTSFLTNNQTDQSRKKFQTFLYLVLNSCYYIHILRVLQGATSSQFEYHTQQCKRLLQLLSLLNKKNFKKQLTIAKVYILLMSVNIKQGYFNQATLQFYQALTHLLIALRILESKNIQDVRLYRRYKKNVLLLITIAFVNYQRMLTEEDCFVGWDTGFSIIKSIQRQLRGQQNNWAKYLRSQYEKDHEVSANKMNEIQKIFIPFLVNQSQVIKELIEMHKMRKKICFQQSLLSAAKSKNWKKNNYCGKEDNSIKLQNSLQVRQETNEEFDGMNSQKIEIGLNSNIQKSGNEKAQLGKKSTIKNRKNIMRSLKFSSIDNLESFIIKQSKTEYLDNILTNKSEQNFQKTVNSQKIEEQTYRSSHKQKTQRKQKNNLLSNSNVSSEAILKFYWNQGKTKRKQCALHRLISSEERYHRTARSSLKYGPNEFNKSVIKREIQQSQNDRKSFQHSLTDIFIKLLIQNKGKLKIKELVSSYELTKKRRKIRNYNLQILQFQLHKSISNLVGSNPNETPHKKTPFKNKYASIVKFVKKDGIQQKQNWTVSYSKEQRNEKQLQNAHNRSKEVIRQMLKKITTTINTKTKIKKTSNNSTLKCTELFLSYQPMQ